MSISKQNIFRRNFNGLGYIYNPLKKIFLWNRPETVISKSVLELNQHQNTLIVGGGADNTVEEILGHRKTDFLTHLDISSVLSQKAQKRISALSLETENVTFKVAPFFEFKTEVKYDAVIFPFYLDLFSEQDVKKNVEFAKNVLAEGAYVYVIDFSSNQKQTTWMQFKVAFLYLVFYPIIGNPRWSIPNFDQLFLESGYTKQFETDYYGGFYSLKVFRLNS